MNIGEWQPKGKKVSNTETIFLRNLGYKWCPQCRTAQAFASFIVNNLNPGNLSSICSGCLSSKVYIKRKIRNELKNANFTTKDKYPSEKDLLHFAAWVPAGKVISHREATSLFNLNLFWCPKCRKALPLHNFSVRRKKTFGVNEMCAKCASIYKSDLAKSSQLNILKKRIRSTLKIALRQGGFRSAGTEAMLGMTIDELRVYLTKGDEELNLSEYQIDHICPNCCALNEDELIKLQHYTNLQLLPPAENGRKNNCKTAKGIELHQLLLGRPWA